jgi:hypothetical protein
VIIEAMSIEDARAHNSSLSISNFLIKKRFLSVYDSLEAHVKFYKKFKPSTIYGFPSYFVNLVSYLEKNSIKLDFIKRIFTSSEVLNDNARKIIKDYFKCDIYDVYGSTETKEISWEKIKLPEIIIVRILSLIQELNLEYACPEFLLSEDGEYYFIDLNPCGDWFGFGTQKDNKAIAEAIATKLCD